MNKYLTYSNHAKSRCASRSIPCELVTILMTYGEAFSVKGKAVSYFLSHEGLKEARAELSRSCYQLIEKKKKAYVVISDTGVVITAAWANVVHKNFKQ